MKALNQLLEEKNVEKNISGQWFAIQWSPDSYANEKLNIGVGLLQSNGDINVQLLDYYERINCLFSNKNITFQLELACKVSRELILQKGIKEKYITPQVTCEVTGFAQGKSVNEILNQLFSSVVTLGNKIKKKRTSNFTSTSRDTVYNSMIEKLKLNLELNYSQYVPENPFMSVKQNNRQHDLYLPYRNKLGVGSLVSAAYSDNHRVKCNLNDAYWDLDLYSHKKTQKNNSIFMLLPDDTLKESNKIKIENQIDQFTWLMKNHGIYVGAHVDSDNLADDICEWCLSAA